MDSRLKERAIVGKQIAGNLVDAGAQVIQLGPNNKRTYQIRIKNLEYSKVKEVLAAKLIQELSISNHSSKFPGLIVHADGFDFEVVVSNKENKGVQFEKHLIACLQEHLNGKPLPISNLFFEKLYKQFILDKDLRIIPRGGALSRKHANSFKEAIADFSVKTENDEIFFSVKSDTGHTIAQLGIAKEFKNLQFKPNSILSLLGIDLNLLEFAIQQHLNGVPLSEELAICNKVIPTPLQLVTQMIGHGYVQVKGIDLQFISIDQTFFKELFDELVVTEIRYPSEKRKLLSLTMVNKHSQMLVLQIRNARGKNSVIPTQIQLKLINSKCS